MIHTVPLANKPLCMVEYQTELFIGYARGRILKLSDSFLSPKCIAEASGPVSTIFFVNGKLHYGTWDGILYTQNKEIKLGLNPIKCGCFFNQKIFISIDNKLIILNEEFKILEKIELESKIFCMDVYSDKIVFGMSNGDVRTFTESLEKNCSNNHTMSILCIRNELTGSTDGSLRKNGDVIFESQNWVRSIFSEDLFSSGKDVFISGKYAYSHKDEVVGTTKIHDTIISIGLDYCYKIFENEIRLTAEEENELLSML